MEPASPLRFIPLLQGLRESREGFSLRMIHASPVETVVLSVFSGGQALCKPRLKISGVIVQYGFQAIPQKDQVVFESLKIFFRDPDAPLLLDAEGVLGMTGAITLTELLLVLIVESGTEAAPVLIRFIRICAPDG